MNTSGLIRGYMSKNIAIEEFMDRVVEALNKEFHGEVDEIKVKLIDENFIITMKECKVVIDKIFAEGLKSPYGLDKYILEELKKQGFKFSKDRSQYIQYCYGNYMGT